MVFDGAVQCGQDGCAEIVIPASLEVEPDPLRSDYSPCLACITLRAERNFFQAQHSRALEREVALKAIVAERDATIRDLTHRIFGQSKETTPGTESSPSGDQPGKKKRKRKRGQQPGNASPSRREHPGLVVREEVHELAAADAACPQCGQAVDPFYRDEVCEVHEVEVRAYTRRIVKRCGRPTCSC